jgi:hypothetical protein
MTSESQISADHPGAPMMPAPPEALPELVRLARRLHRRKKVDVGTGAATLLISAPWLARPSRARSDKSTPATGQVQEQI